MNNKIVFFASMFVTAMLGSELVNEPKVIRTICQQLVDSDSLPQTAIDIRNFSRVSTSTYRCLASHGADDSMGVAHTKTIIESMAKHYKVTPLLAAVYLGLPSAQDYKQNRYNGFEPVLLETIDVGTGKTVEYPIIPIYGELILACKQAKRQAALDGYEKKPYAKSSAFVARMVRALAESLLKDNEKIFDATATLEGGLVYLNIPYPETEKSQPCLLIPDGNKYYSTFFGEPLQDSAIKNPLYAKNCYKINCDNKTGDLIFSQRGNDLDLSSWLFKKYSGYDGYYCNSDDYTFASDVSGLVEAVELPAVSFHTIVQQEEGDKYKAKLVVGMREGWVPYIKNIGEFEQPIDAYFVESDQATTRVLFADKKSLEFIGYEDIYLTKDEHGN